MKNALYPQKYWLSVVAPLLLIVINGPLNGFSYRYEGIGSSVIDSIYEFQLLIIGLSIAVFIMQIVSVRRGLMSRKIIRFELLLMLIGGILFTLGLMIGDITGAAHFNDTRDLTSNYLVGSLFIVPAILAAIFALGNTILLATRSQARRVVRLIGFIVYILLAVAVAITSYFAYAVTYTAHDPSTE